MGLAASQVRYLMLIAHKSDVEFSGQQINQQRTTLSNESSGLYGQLTSMNVPTAPSTSDYTKTTYSFKDADNNNTCSIVSSKYNTSSSTGTVGTYNITYSYDTTSAAKESGEAVYSYNATSKKFYKGAGTHTTELNDSLTQLNGTTLTDTEKVALAGALNKVYGVTCAQNTSGQYTIAGTAKTVTTTTGDTTTDASRFGKTTSTTVSGVTTTTKVDSTGNITTIVVKDKAAGDVAGTTTSGALTTTVAFENDDNNGNDVSKGYYYTLNNDGEYQLVSGSQLNASLSGSASVTPTVDSNATVKYYYVNEDASVQKTATFENCSVIWSDEGRMESLSTADGTTYSLNCTTTTNEEAYNDAYNEYEYEEQVYENKQQSVNAKLDILQAEDKKLELQLENLNSTESAISTELDSVSGVIKKNIEKSFKVFA